MKREEIPFVTKGILLRMRSGEKLMQSHMMQPNPWFLSDGAHGEDKVKQKDIQPLLDLGLIHESHKELNGYLTVYKPTEEEE